MDKACYLCRHMVPMENNAMNKSQHPLTYYVFCITCMHHFARFKQDCDLTHFAKTHLAVPQSKPMSEWTKVTATSQAVYGQHALLFLMSLTHFCY